ncbi:MAG: membrane protein [Candidatus Hydrogenedentota bacterium]
MPVMFLDQLLWMLPAFLLSLYAQFKVKAAYAKYSQIGTRSGLSGAEVAARIVRDANLAISNDPKSARGFAVGLEAVPGHLSDHYDPRDRTLRLSEGVYAGQSIAALGVAAHEVGHAIQHARMYAPLMWRNAIVPMVGITSNLSWFLILGGFFFQAQFPFLLTLGIGLFSVAVAFTLITLPVEFDASRRAMRALADGGYLTQDELHGARKVLNAAALTYVAAACGAVLQLLYLIMAARRE